MMTFKRLLILFIFIALCNGSTNAYAASGIFGVSTTSTDSKSTDVQGSKVTEVSIVSSQSDEEEQKAEAPKEVEKEQEQVIHVVKSGESLWSIAQQHFGDGSRYAEIVAANKDRYPGLEKNPNLIHPGWELVIPQKGDGAEKAPERVPDRVVATETPVVTEQRSSGNNTDVWVVNGEKVGDGSDKAVVEIFSKQVETPKDVTVDRSSGNSEEKVSKSKPLTTMDKINKFNRVVEKASERGEITKLDNKTVKWLIKQGYMSEEEWMDMNPPAGWGYTIKDGRVTLVNKDNRAISNAELIVMAVQEVLDAGVETLVTVADTVEDMSYTIVDAMDGLTDAVEDVSYSIADGVYEITDAIEDVKDSASDAKDSFKEARQELKDAFKELKGAFKKDKKPSKDDVDKVVNNVEAQMDKLYKQSLRKLGMPDFRDIPTSEYLSILNLARFLSPTELIKYNAVFNHNLASMQKNLRASQETYIKKVDKNDTNWIGGSINTAAKNVEKNEANLKDVWQKYKKVVEIANKTAKESAKQLRANERSIRTLTRKRDRLGYKTANAKEVAALSKEIKALEKENDKLQKDVDAYAKVEALLKKMK
jgi:uncharacterized protein Yka (UPF0111/DUF47 family)/LysM repeat protein